MVDREALNPKGLKMWCSSCRIPSCSHSDLGSDFSHASNEGRGGLGKIEVRGFLWTGKCCIYDLCADLVVQCRPGRAGRWCKLQGRGWVNSAASKSAQAQASASAAAAPGAPRPPGPPRSSDLEMESSPPPRARFVTHVVFRVPLCRLSNGQSYHVRWLLHHYNTDKDAWEDLSLRQTLKL